MNIKIKATGIACMLGDDYDRVYTALTRQFGKGSDCLFTERIAGHEYLQWVLPGDGWTALAQSDPIMGAQVREELKLRRQSVMGRFGANVDMANRVLTVPDDEYRYYKADAAGNIDIKFTAWGYRYPERVDGGNATGVITPNATTENISVRIVNNGRPVSGKTFKINDFKRVTDKDGMLCIGNLPVGYQFDIEVDGTKRHCVVTAGESIVEFDCTVYADVDINVLKDGSPAGGAVVSIDYDGSSREVTADAQGHAAVRMPLSPDGVLCTVTVEEEKQQRSLRMGPNVFDFSLISPVVVPPVVPPVVEEEENADPEEEKEEEKKEEEKPEEKPEEGTKEEEKHEEKPEEEDVKEEEKKKPEEEPGEDDGKSSGVGILPMILLLLGLVVLTVLTYYLGWCMLFG